MPIDPAKIAKIASRKQLTGVEIARRAGMPQSSYARLLADRYDPRISTIDRIAQALGVPTAAILTD
jgi:transcriptional regulator with XRE-family HTH domain